MLLHDIYPPRYPKNGVGMSHPASWPSPAWGTPAMSIGYPLSRLRRGGTKSTQGSPPGMKGNAPPFSPGSDRPSQHQ